jgi:alpha-glucosidase
MIESFIAQSKAAYASSRMGQITGYTREGKQFIFRDLHAVLAVTIVSREIIRIRYAPHGSFLPDFSYAIQDYPFSPAEINLSEDKDKYLISTETVRLSIMKDGGEISFYDQNGLLTCADAAGASWEENPEHGGYRIACSRKIQEGENFYGLGDKSSDLNLRGRKFELWSTDAYAYERNTDPLYRNIPFYIGLCRGNAYGMFFDNTYRVAFDFGADDPNSLKFSAEGGEINYYYIHGPHMMDVIKRYSQLTGTHPMPPMWALGYHQCRWSYYPESKLLDLAKTFREKKIPCDALYLDIDYMEGYRCFTWSKEHFPDPAGMISKLNEQGFKTVVIIDPGIRIDPDYEVYKQGQENNFFCRRGDDYFMEGPVWPGRCRFPDFTNPEVREWWGDLHKGLIETGVAGVWCDMNEPSVFGTGTFPEDVRHNYDGYRGSHRKAHNVYGMQMSRAAYEGMRKILRNKRPFTIVRSTYAGGQRYAAAWTGDNVASWDHLHLASVICQRMSMSGFSFVGSDIGGFTKEPDGELFTRWIQLGVFSPFMRAHSAGDTREREPWSYGEPYESICRKYIELRYKLLPYIYSAFWENHKYGFPILRPIVMVEQEQFNNWFRQDEFTFGDKILICPIFEAGAKGRWLYLPQGKWYYYWTNQIFEGGKEDFWLDVTLETMPLFVRAGSVIPEYPVMQHTGERHSDHLNLSIYYSDYLVNSFIYEDHGDTFAYEQDIYTEKKFVVEGSEKNLSIRQSWQGLYTPAYDTYHIRIIGLPFTPSSVIRDGKKVKDYSINEENGQLEMVIFKSFRELEIKG